MSEVTVDFIGFDPDQDACLMVLAEHGPWTAPYDAALAQLEERLFGCMDAALDGHLAERFPPARGKAVIIRVDGFDLPRAELDAFVRRFAETAASLPDYATDASPFVARFVIEMSHIPAPPAA